MYVSGTASAAYAGAGGHEFYPRRRLSLLLPIAPGDSARFMRREAAMEYYRASVVQWLGHLLHTQMKVGTGSSIPPRNIYLICK